MRFTCGCHDCEQLLQRRRGRELRWRSATLVPVGLAYLLNDLEDDFLDLG